ncbi:RNA polymerase II mediator complex subunit Sin4 [Xylariaceae sp. FL0804]|nr:RNA polymerase II mediator complex subunit Sin4 [Xylariaceae sp. FL0804]
MTDNSMPLILDGTMGGEHMHVDLDDVDDLFGDGVPLSLPPRQLSRRLRQRLDDLRGRGCCQGLVWSKSGTIASIAPDGQSLQLRYLRANAKDASWALSEPQTVDCWGTFVGGPIVHLCPSPAGSEIAVVDSVGRVSIINFNADVNRPSHSRRWDGDPVDDLHSVVGTWWLPTTHVRNISFYLLYGPAVKTDNGSEYRIDSSPVPCTGPYHPNPTRSALVCVTTNGLLKLFWNQFDGKPEESTLELEGVTSADDLVTHAAMCADKSRNIFIAMATKSQQLRIVLVGINFGANKPENGQNMAAGNHQIIVALMQRHIAATSWLEAANETPLESSMATVSHIEMIQPFFKYDTKEFTPLLVLVVRSFVPGPSSPYHQEAQSIIDRWELLVDEQQALHSAFEQLAAKRNSVGSAPPKGASLKKLSSIVVNKMVVGVQVISFGKVICFTYNDGSIEYRDRFTMEEIYREVNLDRFSSLQEAGFSCSTEQSCLQFALSPTTASFVQMSEDGQVKWHCPEYTLADPASISDAHLAAVVGALVMPTAATIQSNAAVDDLLAIARKFIHKEHFVVKWVTDLTTTTRATVDYVEDPSQYDHLVRNNTLQLCLSIFNHLGWTGEFKPRHFRGKLSMLALALRNFIILISVATNAPNIIRGSNTPLDDPEVVSTLAGCAKWAVDLICWLCDSLFCLLDDREFMACLSRPNPSQQLVSMNQYLHSKREIALHLILCSSTRNLLSAVCRRIGLLDTYSSRAILFYAQRPENLAADPHQQALYVAYQRIQEHVSSMIVNPTDVDAFLMNLATEIKNAYSSSLAKLADNEAQKAKSQSQQQNPNAPRNDPVKEARQHCELSLLLMNVPPPSFLPVISKMLRKDLAEFRARSDVARLYFADYRLLELDDGPAALSRKRARRMRVDMFKRVEISRRSSAAPWRRCVRCDNVMEDVPLPSPGSGLNLLLNQQRMCCCGGRLAVVP